MSGDEDTRDDQWGNAVARKTFLMTAIGAALFVAAVAIFILSKNVGR